MNKYTIEVNHINSMDTAPLLGKYDDEVEVVILFYRSSNGDVYIVCGYYDCLDNLWRDYYSHSEITEDLLGWLPDYMYVSPC